MQCIVCQDVNLTETIEVITLRNSFKHSQG